MRLTGLATGMDTETTIKQMMKPYTMRVDKMKQDRQILAWRQELYRDILADTDTMKKTFFDVLKSDTYMLSKNNYAGFDVKATNSDPTKSAGVSATASAGAVAGNYNVNVERLASAARLDGGAVAINAIESDPSFDVTKWQGKNIKFKIGGQSPIDIDITIGDSTKVTDRVTLIADINTKLGGKITASEAPGGGIRFNSLSNDSVTVDSSTAPEDMSKWTKPVININKYTTKLSDLGISADGKLTFDYKDSNGIKKEGVEVNVSKNATISQLIDAVNQGTSGAVKLNFSELTGSFSIESLQTGKGSLFKVEDGGTDILAKLSLTAAVKDGTDAKVTITTPGGSQATVERPRNTFSIDGVNYTLTKLSESGTTNDITVTANSQKTYDKIKGFIDKYNELVDKISQKTDEKKQYKFLPLTEEQRTAMKEDEIKQWESKAKVGLLKGDSNLESMLNSMRSAFFQGVDGAGISLSEIGLSTSSDISKRGKIIIDEPKLKAAIETRGEQVANLFTKTSTTYSSYSPDHTSEQINIRSKEEGIFQKINDILQDYTRTSRNNNGKKGILLEKAGIKGDSTEFKSLLSEDIIKKDTKINEMIKSLATRENKYYLQFSKLEVAMNKLNSQSSWLTQQLGGGQ